MAATPLTDAAFTVQGRGSIGDIAVRVVSVALTVGYTGSGGYVMTSKQLGLGGTGVILGVVALGAAGGFHYEWVPASSKLRIRDASGTASAATPEIADATALNTVTVQLLVLGKGHG